MQSKLIAACMALAAFVAFAVVPAVASASPVLNEGGTAVATGSKIFGTNEGNTIMTSGATSTEKLIECSKVKLGGTVTSNTGSHIAGNITTADFEGTGTSGDCTSLTGESVRVTTAIEGGTPWCITTSKLGSFEVRGGECSQASRPLKFTLDFTTSGASCGYEKANQTGSYTANLAGGKFTVFEGGPYKRYHLNGFAGIFCPSEANLDMTFNIETENGTPLTVS
jgi:hypothetical protein